jgi:hypothetical protein
MNVETSKTNPPDYIRDLCQALLEGLQEALAEHLYGVYLFGAVAFPETRYTGDIDFHVILKTPLTERQHVALVALHERLAAEFPPLGVGLDGYYLLLKEAQGKAQPTSQLAPFVRDEAWALHRAHIRAGHCIVLFGPDPGEIYAPASWVELQADLDEQLQYVEIHLQIYPAYCVLNLCRLMYSFENRDVVLSKTQAGEWAWERFPDWQLLIEVAQRDYAHSANHNDLEVMRSEVGEFYQFARDQINTSRKKLEAGG